MAENTKSALDAENSAAAKSPPKQLSPLAAEFVPIEHNNNVDNSGSDSAHSGNNRKTTNRPNNNISPGLEPFLPQPDDDQTQGLVNILPDPNVHSTVLYAPTEDPFASFPRWAYVVGIQNGPTKGDKRMVEFLRTAIQALKYNSVHFEVVAADVPKVCKGLSSNYYVLSNALEDIFHESIINAGFRFVASKLVQLLYMLNPRQHPVFEELLKKKLSHQHDMVEIYMVTRQHGKARNTAHFLTEVCIQLRGDHEIQQLIASTLMQCLWPLASSGTVVNVQCVCLALKTVGNDLIVLCNAGLLQMVSLLEEMSASRPGKHQLVAGVLQLMQFDWKYRWKNAQKASEPCWKYELSGGDSQQYSDEHDLGPGAVGGVGYYGEATAIYPDLEFYEQEPFPFGDEEYDEEEAALNGF